LHAGARGRQIHIRDEQASTLLRRSRSPPAPAHPLNLPRKQAGATLPNTNHRNLHFGKSDHHHHPHLPEHTARSLVFPTLASVGNLPLARSPSPLIARDQPSNRPRPAHPTPAPPRPPPCPKRKSDPPTRVSDPRFRRRPSSPPSIPPLYRPSRRRAAAFHLGSTSRKWLSTRLLLNEMANCSLQSLDRAEFGRHHIQQVDPRSKTFQLVQCHRTLISDHVLTALQDSVRPTHVAQPCRRTLSNFAQQSS
jgi:hypothetical protein